MIQFPDPNKADDEGLIAQGGELTPEFLISAYAQGIFPWFAADQPILWWSPNPRMVLYPQKFKVRKSLRQVINKQKFELRTDENFEAVIKACSAIDRKDQDETWITGSMIEAYCKMHNLGFAHSFEVYHNNQLAGGLYGLSIGNCFFGESMFHYVTDASKVALYYLVQFALKNKFRFIDVQQSTSHLQSMGAEEVDRKVFLELLSQTVSNKTIRGKWKL